MKTKDKTFNYLSEFKELDFKTPEAFFDFEIGKEKTKVTSTYKVERVSETSSELFLNGEAIEFVGLKVNDQNWSEYTLTEKGLFLHKLPSDKNIKIEVSNYNFPEKNTALDGLYVSGPILCTQCEPMGFRRITYSIDRPDNMVKIQTKIRGDKKDFPFMLSNGNKIDKGDDFVTWEDPFPKPLYLFALVAGDLTELSDTFKTRSGSKVDIKFYCDHGAEYKCDFAIESLKKAMKWDEDRFDLEYDLDLYMVVAVDSFNMGAMENKGLNIFNSALVLADPTTATDLDYHRIESVIGHEYFHNWTGNRVTLKNWFQLTLKEGLTVFRDQEFSGDLNDPHVERVDMVQMLKERQFPEDAGPLAHPIRPEKYKEMNNFYTATVYEKGAEVIRMFHTLLGEGKFQKAMEIYFTKYDGKAITTEDFVNTMCDQDLRIDRSLMTRWYKTPGTPHVKITEEYSSLDKTLKIKFIQTNKKAEEKNEGFKETYIPIKFEIFHGGQTRIESSNEQAFIEEKIFILSEKEQDLLVYGVEEDYQVSYLQDFSAPVTYEVESEKRNLTDLALKDTNPFNVFDAIQTSALDFVENKKDDHLKAVKGLFESNSLTMLMKSHLLKPLTFNALIEGLTEFNPSEINSKVNQYKKLVGEGLGEEFLSFCQKKKLKTYNYNMVDKGHRALYFKLIDYLLSSKAYRVEAENILENLFEQSDNMTTSFNCLYFSQTHQVKRSDEISQAFYDQHHKDGLTLQKWIESYLSTPDFDLAEKRIKRVEALEGYSEKTPNFVRALWGTFIRNSNLIHEEGGRGYEQALGAILKIDVINPQMSSAMMKGLSFAPRLKGSSREAMINELDKFNKNQSKFSSHLDETFQSIYGQFDRGVS